MMIALSETFSDRNKVDAYLLDPLSELLARGGDASALARIHREREALQKRTKNRHVRADPSLASRGHNWNAHRYANTNGRAKGEARRMR